MKPGEWKAGRREALFCLQAHEELADGLKGRGIEGTEGTGD